jgi:predicted ATPase
MAVRAYAESDTLIQTPDQRVRVFISSTLEELAAERQAVRNAVTRLRLVPVMFELGARPHPPRELYRAYLAQSQIFIAVYWRRYGWVPPGQVISGIDDEFQLAAGMPRLIYVKSPGPDREPGLAEMLSRIEEQGSVSYQRFSDCAQLQSLVEDDLAILLSERFKMTGTAEAAPERLPAGRLPASPTPLVDRESETAQVERMVADRGVRLVTFTGPGGVGKTRLAVEAAAKLGSRFPDGVRFVDLAAVSAPDLVPAAIASGLGLNSSGGRLVTDIVSYLGSKRLLLLLDNFEQVATAAPVVAELLAAAPRLVVLVTSRTVLRLTGENEIPVPPLSVPPAEGVLDVADLHGYSAVQLFMARAQAASPGFELTDCNAKAIAGICRALDGLPLAIELAAPWIRLLPAQALLARLDDRMSVLASGPRDLPERQRTLKNTLDWSFSLLSAEEKGLFARLGVFAGTFGLPAAAAICGGGKTSGQADDPAHDMATLSSLVASSLVRAEPRDDEPRFRLLETVRDYALDRLRDSGDWDVVHDKHAAYYLALAKPGEAELRGPGQLAWLSRLEIRHDNISAALSWLLARGQAGPALDLVWATWRFWWLHGHAEELVRHVDKILDHCDGMPAHQRALALSGAGFAHFAGGDQARARRLLKQSLPLYQETGDRLGLGLTAAVLGRLLAAQHQITIASDLLEQTMSQLRAMAYQDLTEPERLQYLLDVALAANFLGQIRLDQGDPQTAADLFLDGLNAAHSAADRFTALVSLYDLALSRQAVGDLEDAADLLGQGLSLAAEAGDEPSQAYYLEALADVAARQDHTERAATLLAAASALLEAKGSGWLHAYVPRAQRAEKCVAGSRAGMRDAALDQAQAYGRSLTTADAVTYARGKSPEPARAVEASPAR